jgi:hypothetical protein
MHLDFLDFARQAKAPEIYLTGLGMLLTTVYLWGLSSGRLGSTCGSGRTRSWSW